MAKFELKTMEKIPEETKAYFVDLLNDLYDQNSKEDISHLIAKWDSIPKSEWTPCPEFNNIDSMTPDMIAEIADSFSDSKQTDTLNTKK